MSEQGRVRKWYREIGVTDTQWPYFRMWLIFVIAAEVIMVVFREYLVLIYTFIALMFYIGLMLRITKLYPGEPEPLSLDFSAVMVSLVYAYLSGLVAEGPWQFLLIFTSSLIIFPHLIFIWENK